MPSVLEDSFMAKRKEMITRRKLLQIYRLRCDQSVYGYFHEAVLDYDGIIEMLIIGERERTT